MAKKEKKGRPIIVVEGAPEWMVTFGDLMSLLLTFFILLFSMSEIKEKKIYEVFKSFQTHFEISVPSQGFHVEQLSEVVNMLSQMAIEIPDQKEGKDGKTKTKVPDPFGDNADVVKINNYLFINIEGAVLFDEGSAILKKDAHETLNKISETLSDLDLRIEIRGHTNPAPLPRDSQYRNHMHLGFERAIAVKDWLEVDNSENGGKVGVRPGRVMCSSRGSSDPLQGVNLFNSIERRKLDRVEIMISPEKVIHQRTNKKG